MMSEFKKSNQWTIEWKGWKEGPRPNLLSARMKNAKENTSKAFMWKQKSPSSSSNFPAPARSPLTMSMCIAVSATFWSARAATSFGSTITASGLLGRTTLVLERWIPILSSARWSIHCTARNVECQLVTLTQNLKVTLAWLDSWADSQSYFMTTST